MFPLHRVRISLRSRPRMRPQAMQAYTVPRLMFPPMNRWERKTEKSCTRFSQIPNSVPVHMESAAKGSLVKWTGTPLTRVEKRGPRAENKAVTDTTFIGFRGPKAPKRTDGKAHVWAQARSSSTAKAHNFSHGVL